MAVLRAFIAIELPVEFSEKLEQVSKNLQSRLKGLPLRWVPAKNIHLTLKFLGDVSEASIDVVTEILKTQASNQTSFDVSIGGLGIYPNMKHPRVVWVGVEAPDELMILQRRIDTETARLGYALDKRTYSAHLTMGRVSRSANLEDIRMISQELPKEKVGFLGLANFSEVCLFRSELKPGGAVVFCHLTAYGDEDKDIAFSIQRLRNPARKNFFLPDYFSKLLKKNNFTDVECCEYITHESVNQWIDNGAIDRDQMDMIRDLYKNAQQDFKSIHKIQSQDGDIFDSMKMLIVKGTKK